MERNYAPVIVFSFSKKDCEAYATQMSKLDFNTGDYYLLCLFITRIISTAAAFVFLSAVNISISKTFIHHSTNGRRSNLTCWCVGE